MIGTIFCKLTVTSKPFILGGHSHIRVKCSCGSPEKTIHLGGFKLGHYKSCGCFKHEVHRIHGHSWREGKRKRVTKEYMAWRNMITRTTNPKFNLWHAYGGRGIKMCSEWSEFLRFLADMGPAPRGYYLDRIDVNGNYCKKNCRWATHEQHNNNKQNARIVTWNGKTQTIAQWERELGFSKDTLRQRILKYKIPLARAMDPRPLPTTPSLAPLFRKG